MRKITSTIIGLTKATILTAYMSALTLSNQAFAAFGVPPDTYPIKTQVAAEKQFEKQIISAEEQQVYKILEQEHLPTPAPEPLRP